jgi:hypothetical protein
MKAWTIVSCALVALAATWPSAAPQDRNQEFKTKFRSAAQIKAYDEIGKLLRAYQDETVGYVGLICAQMSLNNSEEIEKELEVLKRCWRDTFKTGFVDKLYEYYSGLALDVPIRKERVELEAKYNQLSDRYQKNVAANDQPTFEILGGEYAVLCENFERLGDRLNAARCAAGAAMCYDDTVRKNQADLRKACEYWGRSVRNFDAIELNHTYYMQCKQRWEALVRLGHGAPPEGTGGGEATPTPAAPAAAAAPITVATTFQAIEGVDQFERPTYFADDIYQIWPEVFLGAKGSTGTFQSEPLKRAGPLIVRTDAAKIGIDVDRDGTPEKTFGLTGNLTTVQFDIGAGDEKRSLAVSFKTGVQEDTFQGLKTNLSPDDNQVRLLVINAGSIVATIGGVPVRVLDDNMDGVYGSPAATYAYAGIAENTFQPELDCVVVGDSKRARPWSKYLEIGGAWYELASNKSGAELVATPTQLATGTIKLEFKGPPLDFLVLKGTGALDGCYFDIAGDAKKPVTVPAGTYELSCGAVSQGKKQQVQKALIMPGPGTATWTVAAGAETVVKLGAPFRFTFKHEAGEDKLKVLGKSVMIEGSANERYDRPWNCTPRPEVSWRKAGAKKGSKPEKMPIVLDLLEQDEKGAYKYTMADTWRPLDLEMEIKKGEEVEVQLVEKKNKLFGEIESAWVK